MKLVVAYIKPERLGDVERTLHAARCPKVSVGAALGGRRRGVLTAAGDYGKVRVEFAIDEESVGATIKAIIAGAWTGKADDGDISVASLSRCIHIGSGEDYCRGAIG